MIKLVGVTVNHNTCGIIQDLQKQFQDRFSDLDSRAEEVGLFQNPFEANVTSCPEALQLELIELQASDMLREKYKGLLVFYKCLSTDDFPNLRHFASAYLSMFGTTYLCEETFSKMKYIKSNLQTSMLDDNLESLLILGTTHLKPDLPTIVRSKKQFHHSH